MDNIFIAVIIIMAILLVALVVLLITRRPGEVGIDEMEGHEFEHFCGKMLEEMGFIDVKVTKGSGDFGVDILAEKDGISYAFQCKCYDKPVGVKAVEEIYAGRDYYERMVGCVITNQYFTQPAVDMAKKLKIMLWDRDYINFSDTEIFKN